MSEHQELPEHTEPNAMALLSALVKAHAIPTGLHGQREPILCIKTMGGTHLQHGHLTEIPETDDALLDELNMGGLVSIEYTGSGSMLITPTSRGRSTVDAYERSQTDEPVADIAPLLEAINSQAAAPNKLAWPAVRPVLGALRDYWMEGGLSSHGIQMRALLLACPEEHANLFKATIRSLVEGGYLESTVALELAGIPTEVVLTDRARAVLDGWPGAAPSDLAQNLIAVLIERADREPDPVRKGRLDRVAEDMKQLGVSVTSEVLSKVITGGM